MANILISYFSDYGEAMYDAITDVLLKNGNNIFRFNINTPAVSISSWGGYSKISDKSVRKKICDFKPQIVLNFNHSLPVEIYDDLSEDCKICVIDADNPNTFWNKQLHLKTARKYVYLGLQSYSKTMYENYLGRALSSFEYMYFPPATVVKRETLKQDKNISFIGSNFYPMSIPPFETDFYTSEGLKLYEAIKKEYYISLSEVKKICQTQNYAWLLEQVRAFYTGQERLKYLQQLTDLGLIFYGLRWWKNIAYYDFELACCFNEKVIRTLAENQWVYNTSKISVNISHPQAKSSFSWRVMDIMASNACLLMEDKPDWRDLFEKYLSPETLENIIYTDRFDMREKAKKLLADEKLRQRCIRELNNAIEQNGRWEKRFAKLQEFVGIPLMNQSGTGAFFFLKNECDCNKADTKNVSSTILYKQKKNFLKRINVKKRTKLFFYLTVLALYQIPIIDIGIRRENRNRILTKIQKYWR